MLTNHAARRKVERGLRNCDICKILKFGIWKNLENEKFKVLMDKDLYVIVDKSKKKIISVINNKKVNTDELFLMIKKKEEAICKAFREMIKKTPVSILQAIFPPLLENQICLKVARAERRQIAEYLKKQTILGDRYDKDYKIEL